MVKSKIILCIFLYFSLQTKSEHSRIFGVTHSTCDEDEGGVLTSGELPTIPNDKDAHLTLYGENLTSNLQIGFASDKNCDYVFSSQLHIEEGTSNHIGLMSLTTPHGEAGMFTSSPYYICLKEEGGVWEFQGESVGFYIENTLFSPVTFIIIMILAYSLSSLLGGLNIGLMALDPSELEMIKKTGKPEEKVYAKRIIPLRRNGNYLLCSILIAITLSNTIATIIIASYFPEWLSVLLTTTVIVLFCEIIPQAICTTYPLYVGGQTAFITRACMIVTFPVSYPLGKILDFVVGKELVMIYDKERLIELLKYSELQKHEENIIFGILGLSQQTVEEVMTILPNIFSLPITAVMDVETITAISRSGYSRIPIYVGEKSNIQHILLTKDLALIDPGDKVPVKVLVQGSKVVCHYIQRGTTLDQLLGIFKDSRSHMVFVVEDLRGSDDDKYVIGLVTFEDIIEEIFQMEIYDETDIYSVDGHKNKPRRANVVPSILLKTPKAPHPSENLKLAIFNFLCELEIFSVKVISPKVLHILLNLDIYYLAPGTNMPADTIYVVNVPADFFILILEGGMEICIGSEGLSFEAGAFRYFGLEALKQEGDSMFIPDYMLQARKKTSYIKIEKCVYDAAVLATKYERFKKIPTLKSDSSLYRYFKMFQTALNTPP